MGTFPRNLASWILANPLSEMDGKLSQNLIPMRYLHGPFLHDVLGAKIQKLQHGCVRGEQAGGLSHLTQLAMIALYGIGVEMILSAISGMSR